MASYNYLNTATKVPNPNKKPNLALKSAKTALPNQVALNSPQPSTKISKYDGMSGSPLRRLKSPTERGNLLLSDNAKLAARAENTPSSLRQSQTVKALKGARSKVGQQPLQTVNSQWPGVGQASKSKFSLGRKSGQPMNKLEA